MAKRDETSIGVMCANQPGSWIWDDAHRPALTLLRLLLDVESDPLHFGQYDFRRKQPVQHRTRRRELVQRHRFVDAQRPVRLAHQLPQVAAHGEPVAEVARDRPQVGAAAASNLDPRHRVRPRLKVKQLRRVDLDLARRQACGLAAPRQRVCAPAADLHRRKRGRLLEDAAGEERQRCGEAARIASLAAVSTNFTASSIGRSISAPAARMCPPPPNAAHMAAASTAPRLRTLIFVRSLDTSLKRMASSRPAMLLRVSMMPSDSAITALASFNIRRETFAHASRPSISTRMVASARPLSLRVVSGRIS